MIYTMRLILLSLTLILVVILTFNDVFKKSISNIEETITPTPQVPQSLFNTDTCFPPCWFGITPGITDSSDVKIILEGMQQVLNLRVLSDSIVNEEEGFIEDGFYGFMFEERGGVRSYIRIDNRNTSLISISINQDITLSQTYEKLGTPTTLWVNNWLYVVIMTLLYDDYNLLVVLYADIENCYVNNIENSFTTHNLYYYDEDFRDRLMRSQQFTESYFVQVTDETLESWRATDSNIACNEAIDTLFDLREQNQKMDD